MTYALAKSLVGLAILASALTATLFMLAVTGRPQSKTPPEKLRGRHRIVGRIFGLLLFGNSLAGFLHFLKVGDGLPLRGILHVYAALALNAVFLIKLGIVKIYRQHLRMAPGLGLTIGALTLVIVLTTTSLVLLGSRPSFSSPLSEPGTKAGAVEPPGNAIAGNRTFQSLCAGCHSSDNAVPKSGPGLKNLFSQPLPSSGLPATPESVHRQILSPRGDMPDFPSIQGREWGDLLAYLRTL
jgi:mono/diheme cytochrome c family protein